jgi:uncharacterized membrane protein YkvA (DUF1232 family)
MKASESTAKETEFYHRLRQTVRIWAGREHTKTSRYADYILASPDLFMLMVRLARDERVSRMNKARMAGAIAYFINPLDLVPEAVLGPAGLVDDVALAAYVLRQALETTDPAVVRGHWEGNADILDLIRHILEAADVMVGGRAWRRLIARAEGFFSPA